MIKRINKIKKLGLVFSDYSRNTLLPDFKKYNLIYGWNGCGKTTLTKLFDSLESGKCETVPDIEYEVEDDQGTKYQQGVPFNQKIRVFNEDYIENNIKIRDGKAKTITLTLGEANKGIVEQIEADKILLKEKTDTLKKESDKCANLISGKNKTFTEIAKTIYVAIIGGAVRNYRKDNAETDFGLLSKKELLVDKELEKLALVVKQKSEPEIEKIKELEIVELNGEKKSLVVYIESIISEAKTLFLKTVESQIIDRFKDNPDISQWAELGLEIHRNHKSENCEFCGQVLPKSRLLDISKYFNAEDKKLKNDIDNLILKLNRLHESIRADVLPNKAQLYEELRKDYETTNLAFYKEKDVLLKKISDIKQLVSEKKVKTTESIVFDQKLDLTKFLELRNLCINYIDEHNKKTLNFETEKNDAIKKLKEHYLSTIFDDVNKTLEDIKKINIAIDKLNNGDPSVPDELGIISLKKRIHDNQTKISSIEKACEEINTNLNTFLGRNELAFELNKIKIRDENGVEKEVDDGYVIKRNGKLANNLSEGEKTAIAFVYFTIQLKDQDFDLNTGIVVVDDPVSSLDSNSLFQAFAFLKNAVIDASQVFILTHNFDFLKLLLNWVKNMDRGSKGNYFMIKNCYTNNCRCAVLDKMDKELAEYESEYHYLFKQLKTFQSDGTIAQSYPIPNIARKVLETFLMFRVPCGEGLYKKLERLENTTSFDKNKFTAIYKFTNDQSHITGSGFDPALVPETQKNVKYLLEMIENVFPEHYKILDESIS